MSSERPWLESLAACVPDGLAFVDARGVVVWANQEFSRMVGIDGGAKGQPLGRFVEHADSILGDLEYALSREARVSRQCVMIRSDGGRDDTAMHAARCDPSTKAAYALHFRSAEEVADLRRKLAERERSHSFLKAGTSDLIVRVDAELRVAWCNESATVCFPEGASLDGLLSPSCLAILRGILETSGAGDGKHVLELESHPERRPRFFLKGVARPLIDETGACAGISMILCDDSENRRLSILASRLHLSAREEEIVGYLLQGYSNLNIASILGLSESGVKFHIRNVFNRAQVNTRMELMAMLLAE